MVNKAKSDPAFRAAVEPALRRIQSGLDMAADQIAKLGDSAKATIGTIRAKLDDLLGPATSKVDDPATFHLREPEASRAESGVIYNADVLKVSELTGLSPKRIEEIKLVGRGNRPDPSTYMSKAAIAKHLDVFRSEGAVRFTTSSDIARFEKIGQADGSFVIAKSELDDLIARTGGDKSLIEDALGLAKGRLSNGDTVIAWVKPENLDGLRFPSGNEGPANDFWIPGGYTPGGNREAVLNMPASVKFTAISIGK